METLLELKELILDCKKGEELWETLTSYAKEDEDSTIIGLYWFTCDYYYGQTDPMYALQCKISEYYRPGLCCNGCEENSFEEMVYNELGSIYYPEKS